MQIKFHPTQRFSLAKLLSKWGYIVFLNDGAIMSQISPNLTIVKKSKLLDQVGDAIRTKQYRIKPKKLISTGLSGSFYFTTSDITTR